MLEISVVGLEELTRNLANLDRSIPEAIAKGLNRTGETLIERQRLEMQNKIKGGPVPYTLNAHGQWKARPQAGRLDTVVFVKDKQAEYLQGPIEGKDYSGLQPGPAARVNQYGNIINKRNRLAGIRGKLRSGGEFVKRVKGVASHGRYEGQPFNIFARWSRLPGARGEKGKLTVVAKSVRNKDRDITLKWEQVAEDWVFRKLPDYIQNEFDLVLELYGDRARM